LMLWNKTLLTTEELLLLALWCRVDCRQTRCLQWKT
jgi:hypothetical protein